MTFVDDKIKKLSDENRKKFEETLEAILSEEPYEIGSWLSLRGFKENYSLDMVKLTLYREIFEGDFSRLNPENY